MDWAPPSEGAVETSWPLRRPLERIGAKEYNYQRSGNLLRADLVSRRVDHHNLDGSCGDLPRLASPGK